MEPHTAAVPKPIVDVAPPVKNHAAEATLAQPPNNETAPATNTQTKAIKAEPVKPSTQVLTKSASKTPVLIIVMALLFFVALSALAFYAYSKSK